MERIQEGQPFTIFIESANTPAQLEKLFRHIRKLLPKDSKIFGVLSQSQKKKSLEEKLMRISMRYCDTLYFAPCSGSEESKQMIFEKAFRRADFGDCVLILGSGEGSTAREAARQVAYELDLID